MAPRFTVTEADLPGVLLIVPTLHADDRGYFFDSYDLEELRAFGLPPFVQQSQSLSRQGVVRGLHFQHPPYAQAKLVRVLRGKIMDIIVDMRHGSPTLGKHTSLELSDDDHKQVFIPEGFAHGFSVLSEDAIVLYNLSRPYAPQAEGGIYYADPDLQIDWCVQEPIVSMKDRKWPAWRQVVGF